MKLLFELVRKDLRIFVADKRAMIISFSVPVAIACFMALIFGSQGTASKPTKMTLLVADNDHSEVSKKIFTNLQASASLAPKLVTEEEAEKAVRSSDAPIALVLPEGFGAASKGAFTGGEKPEITLLTDPSKAIEVQAVRGTMVQPILKAMANASFGDAEGDMALPFDTDVQPQAAPASDNSNVTVAHVFAGMAVQGVLFFSIEAGMALMRDRRLGLWRRMRAAPVSPSMLLCGSAVSATIRALAILGVVFGIGMLAFHIQVMGAWSGLVVIALVTALMAATFGLFIAALGRNEQQSRGLAVLVVLAMSMLGGAWFPSFLMPTWVQSVTKIIPARWAVDGFDAVLWRGMSLAEILPFAGVLLAFSAVFAIIALRRFRWDVEIA